MRLPAETFHPAEFIREELEARGWTVADLARRIPYKDANEYGINHLAIEMYLEVAEPDLRLGDLAEKISAAFGCDHNLFGNLERAYLARTNQGAEP